MLQFVLGNFIEKKLYSLLVAKSPLTLSMAAPIIASRESASAM